MLEDLSDVSPRPNISSKDHGSIVGVKRAGPFLRKRGMRNMYTAKGRCLTGSFVPACAHLRSRETPRTELRSCASVPTTIDAYHVAKMKSKRGDFHVRIYALWTE